MDIESQVAVLAVGLFLLWLGWTIYEPAQGLIAAALEIVPIVAFLAVSYTIERHP